MSLPFDQLLKPLTAAQVKATLYSLLAALGLPVTSWKEGAVVRTIIAVISTVFGGFTELMVLVARSGFLDTASGAWLTLLAEQVYDVARILATFATGQVTLTNAGGGLYSFAAGDLVVTAPGAKKSYSNVSAITLNPLSTLVVDVQALELGTASNAAPGTVTALATAIPKVTVTNAGSILGSDEETDADLRARCRDKLGALSPNGPKAAYSYFAKSAQRADGTYVGATRVKVSPSGVPVEVIVAGPAGAISGDPLDPATDLGAIAVAIEQNCVPNGVTYTLASATEHALAVACDVWIDKGAGLTSGEVTTASTTAIESFFAASPIGGVDLGGGGFVFRNSLLASIASISPAVLKVDVTAPAADEALAADEVPVLSGAPTVTVHFV